MKQLLRLRVFAFVLVALAAFPALAQTAAHTSPTIKFEKYKLPNGLEVILSEDHRLPMVAVNLWYHVGPANEKPGRTGFAHLFEHMMFQGSKHVQANEHFKLLEGAGASDINGTTEFDRTNYFETLPSNQLELALWLESDRMGWLIDNLTARNLANQRDVVRNERREGENRPYELVEEELYHELFPQGHPYYASVIGSHADIESAHLQDVREFFKQYYTPNNASLAIVGDFQRSQIKQLVEKYFGPIPQGPPVPKIDAKTPAITSQRRKTVTDKVELPRVYIAWITPPIFKPGDADAELLANILGGGKSSRLYKKLVYEKQIAQTVSAENDSLMLGSVFEVTATAKPGVKVEDLEKAVDEEIAALQKDGPTSAEVERARNSIESQKIRGLERLGGFGGVADRLNSYNHYLGDPGYLPKDLARYDNATPASVKKLALTLTSDSSAVVYGVPGNKVVEDVPKRTDVEKDEAARNMTGDEWRVHPPKPGPASAMSLPVPQRFALPNGLNVYLVEQHNLPVMAANLVMLTGSDANPPDKPGLASFTAAMLTEGTQKRSALQIPDDADQIGATINSGSNADSSFVAVRSLTKTSDQAFDLLSDVALNPAFQDKEIERVRKQRLTSILQQHDSPQVIATKVFYSEVYGPKSPYGYIETGTEASNKAITREDMMGFYKAGYVPKNAALMVAGDMTASQLRSLAEKYFGQWTGSATQSQPPAVSDEKMARRIVIVDKPGSPQTQLRIGHVGLARSNPDYVPVQVMNTELGGLFSSRINLNLREQHGYTYGAFSTFQFRRARGPFFAGGGIRTDATAPAVKEVFNEFNRMRDTQLTPDELALAKDSISHSLPGYFETTPQTAAAIGNIFVYNLPMDYYRTLPGRIDTVSAADVQRVAQQYLWPENMVVVAVGDRKKIEPGLKGLDLGSIEARDLEGKPVSTPGN